MSRRHGEHRAVQFARRIGFAAALCMGSRAAAALAQAPPTGGEPPAQPEDDAEQQYSRGFQLFAHARYAEASREFQTLFARFDGLGRTAQVAYALAQCLRYRGEFPSAFDYYRYAYDEYARAETGPVDGRLSESRQHMEEMQHNLAVVTLGWPSAVAPGTSLCRLEVDGSAPVRYARALPWVSSDSIGPHRLRGIARAMEEGGLAGVRRESGLRHPEACTQAATSVVVDVTQDHDITYLWRDHEGRTQPASLKIEKSWLSSGAVWLPLEHQKATIALRFLHEGLPIAETDARRASAVLSPADGGQPFQILNHGSLVLPGRYTLAVALHDWEVSGHPIRVTLEPGEQRSVDVDLSRPPTPLYLRSWFVIGGVVLVAAAVITGLALSNDAAQNQSVRLDRGNLDWVLPL